MCCRGLPPALDLGVKAGTLPQERKGGSYQGEFMHSRFMACTVVAGLMLASGQGRAASSGSVLDTEFDSLYAQASKQATGDAVPQVLFKLARERAGSAGAKLTDMGRLANYLADDYTLYTKIHVEVIQGQCAAEGADLSAYLAELAADDQRDADVTTKIYTRLGSNYDRVWLQLKPQAVSGAPGIISHFAAVLGVPADTFCSRLAKDPKGSAGRLSYVSTHPSRSQVLQAIRPEVDQ